MNTKKSCHPFYHRRGITPFRRKFLCLIVLFFFSSNLAFANPNGPQVVNGNVSFNTQGNTLTITNSPNSIINWQGFSIGINELTRFIQQSGNSAILNRVIGQDPSAILGALQSNGRVFLINPNGILFGAGARIDVNGLIASTLNLSNQDFLAGRYNFTAGLTAGSIENQGTITTPTGGRVYLIAPDIKNTGIINSPKGEVILAAGRSVQLVDSTNPDIAVVVSAPENSVVNLGQIIADSGRIGIYGGLISQKGIVRADSAVVGENGQIFFKATKGITLDKDSLTTANGPQGGKISIQSETDTTLASGTISATGSEGKGGEVKVLGKQVGLIDSALVDASGTTGGGTVLVGGDYQGKNAEIQNAAATYVGPDATIRADATVSGDGGKVIVWSDNATRFYGTISAKGGAHSGNGGFVEVSGKQNLRFEGFVDTFSPGGKSGTLLLDPNDLYVGADPGSGAIEDTTNPFEAKTDPNDYFITKATLEALGTDINVILDANHDIIFNQSLSMAQTTGSVTATAVNNINLGSYDLSTAGGAITLNSATMTLGDLNAGGGSLTINNSGSASQTAGKVIAGSGALTKTGAGTLILSQANTYTGGTNINAGTLAVSGATAKAGNGGTIAVGANTLNIDNGAALANAVTITTGTIGNTAGAGTLETGGITLGGAANLSSTGDGLTVSAVIADGAGTTVTKTGTGTVTLSGNNTYTGLTTVSVGTLKLGAAGDGTNTPLGTVAAGTSVTSGATLDLNGYTLSTAEDLTLNGTGVGGTAGALTNSAAGAVTYGGLLALGGESSIVASNGNIVLSNTGTITGDTFGLTLGGTNTASSLASIIGTGAGTLTKTGAGTWTLSGANIYTGGTNINAGTLKLGASGVLADAGAVTLADVSGAIWDLAGQSETIGSLAGGGTTGGVVTNSATNTPVTLTTGDAANTTFSGVIQDGADTSTIALTKQGGGIFTLAGANTYTGGTNINAGTLAVSGATAKAGNGGTIAVGANTLNIDNGAALANAVTITTGTIGNTVGAGTLETGGVTLGGAANLSSTGDGLTVSAVITDGAGTTVTKTGTGTVTISGNNTYTGLTTVSAGTLNLNTTGSNAIVGNLTVSGGSAVLQQSDQIADGKNVVVSGGTLAIGANSNTVAGVQLTDGSITGTGGTLTSTTDFDMQKGTVSAILGGAVALTKSTGNTVTLSGANTYMGVTAINAGVLNIQNAQGTGTTAGGVTVANGAALELQGGITVGTETLTLNGTGVSNGGALRSISGNNTWSGAITDTTNSVRINSDADTLTLTGNIDNGGNLLTLGGLGNITQAAGAESTISGLGGLTKTDAGTLTLDTGNTYTGKTTISGGTVKINAADALGDVSGGLQADYLSMAAGTTLQATDNVSIEANRGITLTGAATITADDTKTITLGSDIANGASTLTLGGAGAITETAGKVISGTGGLTKTGAGTLTLADSNTYTGKTAINGGIVKISADTGLGAAPGGAVADQLSINAGTLQTMANVSLSVNRGITLAGAGTLQSDAGTLTINGNIGNGGNLLTLGGAGNITQAGAGSIISGTGGLTKTDAGILTLSGANTYSGATSINAGTVKIGHMSGLGSTAAGTIVSDTGAALDLNGIAVGAEAVTLNGTGVDSAGALRNSSGTAASLSGVIALGSSSTITSTGAGGLTLSGGITTDTGKDLTFDGANATTVSTAKITGGGALTKNGAGTLNLNVANDYTGATTINAGTVKLGDAAGLGSTAAGTTVTATGAALDLNGQAVGAEAVTLNGTGVGGAGALLNSSGTAASLNGAIALGSSSTITSTGAGGLTLTGGITTASGKDVTFNGANATTVSTAKITGGGALIKNGAGILNLNVANDYTGATTIGIGGTLALDATGKIEASSGVANAGTFTIAADKTIDSLTGAGGTTLGAYTLTIGDATGTSGTYSGVASGAGGITKAGTGTLTLSGANTYTGTTNVNGGTLIAASNNALGTNVAGTNIASGSTLGFQGGINYSTAEAVTLNGGILRNVAGNNTFAGPVTLVANSAITVADDTGFTLSGAVDGNNNLDITIGTGTLTFNGAVGSITPIGTGTGKAITINSGSGTTKFNSTLDTAAPITISANVEFKDNVSIGVGDGTGTNLNAGITFEKATGLTFSVGGDLTLAGEITTSASDGTINLASGKSLTVTCDSDITAAAGALTLTADNMSLNGTINGGTGLVTLTPKTAATVIQLGVAAADGSGVLGLSQDELDKITTAGGLTIGSAENTGGIDVLSAGANLAGSGNTVTGSSKLQTGGGNITLTGSLSAPGDLTLDTRGGGATTGQVTGGGALTAGTGGSEALTVNASQGINLSGSNNARTVHLNNDTSGNVNYTSSVGSGNTLTVDGTKNGLSEIFSVTESTGNLTVGAGNITTQGSEVSLAATQVDGLLTTTGNIDTGSGANITLTADNMNLIGNLDAGAGGGRGVTLQPNANTTINIGVGAADNVGVLGLTETELQTVTADKLIIGKDTAGAMTIAGGLSLTYVPTLKLISGAGITGAGNTISVANLALSGGTGAVDMKTAVPQLAAQNSSGGITISNTNSSGLTVGNIEGVTGISSNNGDISLTETAGDITIASTVDAGTGNVTLKAAGALVNGGASSDVDISAKSLNATAGNGIGHQNALHTKVANLTAESTGAGSNNIEITNTGSLNVTGGIMNSGSGGIILDNTGAVDTGSKNISASGGSVTVTTHSPLTVGSGGITAESDVTLEAAPSSGDDTLTINGPVKSSSGDIILKAGDAIVQNSTLEAANGDVYRNGVSDRSVAAQLGKANIIALDNTLGQKDADGNDNKKDKDKDQEIDKKKAKDGKSDETDKTKLPYCN